MTSSHCGAELGESAPALSGNGMLRPSFLSKYSFLPLLWSRDRSRASQPVQVARASFQKEAQPWRMGAGRRGRRGIDLSACSCPSRSPQPCLGSGSPGSPALVHPHGFLRSRTIAVLSGAINFSKADPGKRQLLSKQAPSGPTASSTRGAFQSHSVLGAGLRGGPCRGGC